MGKGDGDRGADEERDGSDDGDADEEHAEAAGSRPDGRQDDHVETGHKEGRYQVVQHARTRFAVPVHYVADDHQDHPQQDGDPEGAEEQRRPLPEERARWIGVVDPDEKP